MSKKLVFVSVIVSTYNWPEALGAVLAALEDQSYPSSHFEVVIADDGSTEATRELICTFQDRGKIKIKHVWQPDEGFRAAQARNKAIANAIGEYLIFIDGDSVPLPVFIARHVDLAKANKFVVGNRILLNQVLTEKILKSSVPIHRWSVWDFFKASLKKQVNRCHTLFFIPLGFLRYLRPLQWKGAKTCNLGVWKKDLVSINGFDESYVGWGYEDSDLIVRLFHLGVRRKSGKFAVPVLHLWHPESSREAAKENYERLMSVIGSRKIKADRGLSEG